MMKRARKKDAKKNVFWSTSQLQKYFKHMHFHFSKNRFNEALKNILPQRQLYSSIPNQETYRLLSWFMYPIASSCQGYGEESRIILKTYAVLHLFSKSQAIVIVVEPDTETKRFIGLRLAQLAKICEDDQRSTYFTHLLIWS